MEYSHARDLPILGLATTNLHHDLRFSQDHKVAGKPIRGAIRYQQNACEREQKSVPDALGTHADLLPKELQVHKLRDITKHMLRRRHSPLGTFDGVVYSQITSRLEEYLYSPDRLAPSIDT